MSQRAVIFSVITSLFLSVACLAEDDDNVNIKLIPSGFAFMEMGKIVTGGINKKSGLPMDNTWTRQLIAGLSVKAAFSEKSFLDIGMEMQMYNSFPIRGMELYQEFRYQNFYPYLDKAEYVRSFGPPTKPFLTARAGYFRFKYNGDVKNLGEYLFRTGTYPQYIINIADFPLARLMGFQLRYAPNVSGFQGLTVDGLFYTNLRWYAVGDWNLGAIVSYQPTDGIDLGLGLTLNSIFSADESLTTPHNTSTLYHIRHNETSGKSDSSFYTFRGAKLMARASFDPKKFISLSFAGKADFRIYAEAAILGLRDYPINFNQGVRYDDFLKRTPIMAGFNWPTHPFAAYFSVLAPEILAAYLPDKKFKSDEIMTMSMTAGAGAAAGALTWLLERWLKEKIRLDALALEVEWFNSPYPNDIGVLVDRSLPIPGQVGGVGDRDMNYRGGPDKWKWSLYATKKFYRHYTFTAQIASDHLRPLAINNPNVEFEEALHAPDHWYYLIKIAAGF